ncbi:MAG: F0F1 ATP synthase subunit epsilon [Deltaproteobacteria bacterium]|nr:MAG: F0F1 ATP synthase subunit epsilon [Deltaproteobacteria bacterium]
MVDSGKIHLRVVSPHGKILETEADEVSAQGEWGTFGVLPDHTPYLVRLEIGPLWYRQGEKIHYVAVAGGIAEVGPRHVTVLAEAAEIATKIDVERAKEAKARAERRLKELTLDDAAYIQAEAALKRALTRLSVASG